MEERPGEGTNGLCPMEERHPLPQAPGPKLQRWHPLGADNGEQAGPC